MSPIGRKDGASDLIWCTGRNSIVAVNRTAFQSAYIEETTLVARAAHKGRFREQVRLRGQRKDQQGLR
jgi:hypothetical protein